MAGSTNKGVPYFAMVVGSRVPPGTGDAVARVPRNTPGTNNAAPAKAPAPMTFRRVTTVDFPFWTDVARGPSTPGLGAGRAARPGPLFLVVGSVAGGRGYLRAPLRPGGARSAG